MLSTSLPNRRLGLSAEIAELEEQIASEMTALGHAIGPKEKAEIRRRISDDRKELGFVKLGEINREQAFLRSGGEVMRTTLARDLELALAKRDQADQSEKGKTSDL